MAEDAFYKIGLKAFINRNGEVLTLTHSKYGLDYPGGKIQVGESFEEALKREVREETGLEIEIGKPFAVWKGTVRDDLVLVGFRCEFKTGAVELSHEHTKFKWVSKHDFKEVFDTNKYFEALIEYFEGA